MSASCRSERPQPRTEKDGMNKWQEMMMLAGLHVSTLRLTFWPLCLVPDEPVERRLARFDLNSPLRGQWPYQSHSSYWQKVRDCLWCHQARDTFPRKVTSFVLLPSLTGITTSSGNVPDGALSQEPDAPRCNLHCALILLHFKFVRN